jgi:hypothetical protein
MLQILTLLAAIDEMVAGSRVGRSDAWRAAELELTAAVSPKAYLARPAV